MTTAIAPRRLRRTVLAGAMLTGTVLAAVLPTAASAVVRPVPLVDGTVAPAVSAGSIKLTPVASGLSSPVLITSARDGTGRMFIVEQGGKILVLSNGSVLSTPLLDISGSVSKGPEQGLLGLAFHPNFKSNHKFYVNFTNTSGNTVVREYRTSTSNPNRVAAGSGRNVLHVKQPFANHNGGNLVFGPDRLLYIGMGDGGDAGDPGNRAQSKNSLLGKMLRINVNGRTGSKAYAIPRSNPYVGKPGLNEIYQRGLRNPWRFSFDRATGKLWIGDVGQGAWEEIDRGGHAGTNWGWRQMEGYHCYNPSTGCSTSGKSMPVLNYAHTSGRCAVTGGFVYRGSNIPALRGWYVFGDYCSGEIWAIPSTAGAHASKTLLRNTSFQISSFGESAGGELFVVDLGGTIYRIDHA
jgi:glucose/arabinose dehydrogenase